MPSSGSARATSPPATYDARTTNAGPTPWWQWPAPAAACPPEGMRAVPVLDILIDHRSLDTLLRGEKVPESRFRDIVCRTAGGHDLDLSEAASLVMWAEVRRVVVDTDRGHVINYGRKSTAVHRAPPARPLCSAPPRASGPAAACPTRRCEVDHARSWARHGGGTNQDNADPLCRSHNWLKEHGYRVPTRRVRPLARLPPRRPRDPLTATPALACPDTGAPGRHATAAGRLSGAGEDGGAAFEERGDTLAVVVALEARRDRGGVALHVLADRSGQAVVDERLDQAEAVRRARPIWAARSIAAPGGRRSGPRRARSRAVSASAASIIAPV